MAFTFLGLTVGDDGTGFKMPTYAAWRGAISQKLRQLRAIANLNTEPGSLYGDMVDLVVTGVYLAGQAASEAVSRTRVLLRPADARAHLARVARARRPDPHERHGADDRVTC